MTKDEHLAEQLARALKAKQDKASAPTRLTADDTLGRILCASYPWARWYALAASFTMITLILLLMIASFVHGGSWAGANAWLGDVWARIRHLAAFSIGFAALLLAFRATFKTPPRVPPRRRA